MRPQPRHPRSHCMTWTFASSDPVIFRGRGTFCVITGRRIEFIVGGLPGPGAGVRAGCYSMTTFTIAPARRNSRPDPGSTQLHFVFLFHDAVPRLADDIYAARRSGWRRTRHLCRLEEAQPTFPCTLVFPFFLTGSCLFMPPALTSCFLVFGGRFIAILPYIGVRAVSFSRFGACVEAVEAMVFLDFD